MEIIKILFNKKTRKGIGDVSSNYLESLFDFMGTTVWVYEPEQIEKEVQDGKKRWHCNTSVLTLMNDGNFSLSSEAGQNDNHFIVSRAALYDFMEKWKKIDEEAFEKIIITFDSNKFEIETYEKMTPEEENDPMWVDRFSPKD